MVLRRGTYKWGPRNEALTKARVSRGLYRCVMCGPLISHPKKNIKIDHIEPVVPITGFDNWDGYIERMFCPADGFQVLCEMHHDRKTKEENEARRAFKDVMEGKSEKSSTPFKKKGSRRRK